jgi:hypothetical protein
MRVLTVPGLDHQAAFSPADQPVKKTPKRNIKGTASPEYQKLHIVHVSSHKFVATSNGFSPA